MWGDADTAIGGNRDRFPSTQLSLIEAAAGEPLALERVVALYWKPVYKFIRSKFHQDNEAAKHLTQGFFASALERDFFQRFDPSKAAFRTYLRLAVERFAANRHQAGNRQKRAFFSASHGRGSVWQYGVRQVSCDWRAFRQIPHFHVARSPSRLLSASS